MEGMEIPGKNVENKNSREALVIHAIASFGTIYLRRCGCLVKSARDLVTSVHIRFVDWKGVGTEYRWRRSYQDHGKGVYASNILA